MWSIRGLVVEAQRKYLLCFHNIQIFIKLSKNKGSAPCRSSQIIHSYLVKISRSYRVELEPVCKCLF